MKHFWVSGVLSIVATMSPLFGASAAWTESVLYTGSTIGTYPGGGVIFGPSGKLYGEAEAGGQRNEGTIYELKPPAGKATFWTGTVLHNFNGADGASATFGLVSDKKGNLYGAREEGGRWNAGVIFELSPPAAGKTGWIRTIIHEFRGSDGADPAGAVTLDAEGNVYGTTIFGGVNDNGVVFKCSPPAAGKTVWTETVLHKFNGGSDGISPFYTGVTLDAAGNLYGATTSGGAKGAGIVFKLARPAAGKVIWTETVLHTFGNEAGGAPPRGPAYFGSRRQSLRDNGTRRHWLWCGLQVDTAYCRKNRMD